MESWQYFFEEPFGVGIFDQLGLKIAVDLFFVGRTDKVETMAGPRKIWLLCLNHYKGKLPPILSGSLLFIESTIPDTLFFQPAFPFSDYCLKHRKAQFVEYQPEES